MGKTNMKMNNLNIEYKDDDIAIIGVGLHIGDTKGIDEYWEIFENNIDCIRDLPKCRRDDLEDLAQLHLQMLIQNGNGSISYNKACYLERIDEFDSEYFKISPREAQVMDPIQRILLETIIETFDDAGYTPEMLSGSKTGIYIGYTPGSMKDNYSTNISFNHPELLKYSSVGNMPCIIPSRASYALNLQGPTMLIDSACSSSLVAIHHACESIKNGTCTMAIAGGIRLHSFPIVCEDSNVGFETDDNRTRTFDNFASGSAVGEGSACVFLKSLKAAEKDKDVIYAVIKATAVNNDGTSASITAPNPAAQTNVILNALKIAGISPENIDYIETHGTATALGDPIEFRGLTNAFEKYTGKRQFCALSASKSNIGHLYEAAGVAALIKALAAMKHKRIPGTSHFNTPNLKIDFCDSPFYINTQTRNWEKDGLRVCGVSAFGISGTNCHAILQEYKNNVDDLKLPEKNILGISAKSLESMSSLLKKYKEYMENNTIDVNLFVGNANLYRNHYSKRLAIVFEGKDNLIDILSDLSNCDPDEWNDIKGVYYLNNENEKNQIDYNELRASLKRCNSNILSCLEGKSTDTLLSELENDYEYLAKSYGHGAKLDWRLFYKGFEPRHISIPYYQFKRSRCWLPKKEQKRNWTFLADTMVEGAEKNAGVDPDLYYKRVFVEAEPVEKNTGLDRCLLIRQKHDKFNELYIGLKGRFFDVKVLYIDGDEAKKIGIERYFEHLYSEIDFKDISHIVFTGLGLSGDVLLAEDLLHAHKLQLLSVICLYRELSNHDDKLKVIPIMNNCFNAVGDEEYLNPDNSPVFGMCKSLNRMFKNINSCCIDIDNKTGWDKIVNEICALSQKDIIAYRKGTRYYEGLSEVQIEAGKKQAVIKDNGVYFISGGLGGIGFETAMEMTRCAKNVSLILIGRSKLPEKSEWDSILQNKPESETAEKIERISTLKNNTKNVEYYAIDISDADALKSVIQSAAEKYGKINGVVHAAGVSGSITFDRLNEEYITKMLIPKVVGTYVLDHATRDQDLDFFLMFSSISTIFSSADLLGYISGNMYLDSYSDYRKKACGSKSITVNWATWSEIGMAVKSNFTIDTLFQTIKTRDAINALFDVLSNGSGSTVVARLNLKDKISLLLKTYPMHYSAKITEFLKETENSSSSFQLSKSNGNGVQYGNIEETLIKICCQNLGYEDISIHHNFFELGANSIMLSIIFKDLNMEFPGILQVTDLFSYPTVSLLAEYISSKLAQDNVNPENSNNNLDSDNSNFNKSESDNSAINSSSIISVNDNVTVKSNTVSYIKSNSAEENNNSIAIIGVGMDIPACKNLEQYWDMLINGINAVRDIPSERAVDITKHLLSRGFSEEQIRFRKCGYLDEVNKFDYGFFGISPRDASLLDPVNRIFLQCCANAIDDAGYGADCIKGSNTGIFLGYTANIGNVYNRLLYEIDPKLFSAALPIGQVSMTASRTAYVFDLKGPSMVIDTACSSSLVALHMACEQIRFGKCEMALAGGASIMSIPLDDGSGIGFESPEEKTRAFSNNSSGTAIAEGVGVVLLKSLKKAQMDGDSIYAVIKGSAINQDGSSFGIAAPNYLAQSEAIQKAWEDAGVTAKDITYIEAHGTGTQLGDPIEIKGITNAFSAFTDEKQICGLGSVKTNIGHANEAAGMCGLFKCILTFQNKLIPPTLNFQAPNNNIDFINSPLYIVDKPTPLKPKGEKAIIGISGFGMSGTNAHIILEEAPKSPISNENKVKSPRIFTVSARNEKAVFQLIERYKVYLQKNNSIDLTDLTCTLNIGRKHYSYRLAFIFNNQSELIKKLSELSEFEAFEMIKNDWCIFGHYAIAPESKKQKYPHEITSKEQQKISEEANAYCRKIDKKNSVELQAIIKLYIKGADIDWKELYNERYTKLHLPTYPYAKSHAWYPIPFKEKMQLNNDVALLAKDKMQYHSDAIFDTFFHNKGWVVQKDLIINLPENDEAYVVIHSDNGSEDLLSQKITEKGVRVIDAFLSNDGFNKINDNTYYIENSIENYKQLFEQLAGVKISKIVHACAYRNNQVNNVNELFAELEYGFFNIINLVKGIVKARFDRDIKLVVIACNAYGVTGKEEHILPHNAVALSLGKVVEQEYHNICCRAIDTDKYTSANDIAEQLLADHNIYLVCLRKGKSYIEEFDEAEVNPEVENRIVAGGTYIITGGTSGIGIQIAKLFSRNADCNLILLSRKGFPDESIWKDYLAKEDYSEKIKDFEEIKKNGSTLEFIKCDISNLDDVQKMLDFVRNKYKKINGVVHSAGITQPGFIVRKERDSFLSVLAPKISGTWNIDKLTQKDNLDFILLNSSNVTDAGEPGQSDYIAANAYLDSYTDYLNAQGRNTYTVNWVAWKETGMAYKHGTNMDTTTKAITNDDALKALNRLLRSKPQRVIIGQFSEKADLLLLVQNCRNSVAPGFMAKIFKASLKSQMQESAAANICAVAPSPVLQKTNIGISIPEANLTGNVEGIYTPVEKQIGRIYCDILGCEEADIYEGFFEMGGDSILLTEMHDAINKLYPSIVKVADLFEFDSIHSLSGFISSKQKSDENIEKEKINEEMDNNKKEQLECSYYGMSCPQERIYFDYRLSKNKYAYNIGFISDKSNDEYEDLAIAANNFFTRFDMLRTTFKVVNKKLVQCINPVKPINIDRVKVPSIEGIDYTKYIKAFNLSEYPLFNLTFFEAPGKKMLFVDVHHILIDGYSTTLLQEYMEAVGRGTTLDKPLCPYTKFVDFEKRFYNSQEYKSMGEYWKGQLKGFDFSNPLGGNIADNNSNGYTSIKLCPELAGSMLKYAKKRNTTLFNIFLGAYALALGIFTKRKDIAILIPVLNRYEPEFMNCIGVFTNLIPIRLDMQTNLSVKNFIENVTQTTIGGIKNQFFQYNHIIEDFRGSNPQFFFYMDFEDKSLKKNRNTEDIPYAVNIPKFMLDLEIKNLNNIYNVGASYKKGYFSDAGVAHILGLLVKIMEVIFASDKLNITLEDFIRQIEAGGANG